MDSTGLRLSNYDAISEEYELLDRRFVAKIIELGNNNGTNRTDNPSFAQQHRCFIQYYKVDKDGRLLRLENN